MWVKINQIIILINIHQCSNIFHHVKVLIKVIKTETLTFHHNKFIKLGILCFSIFSMSMTALLAKTPAQAETLLHSLERAAAGIGLHDNADKSEYMCFNQRGDISTLNGSSLKLVDKFTYLGSSVSSTKTDINTRITKAWTVIDRLLVIWKSDLTNKIKRSFFQSVVVSILLYGCITWTLTKCMEKKLDSNYTRMLWAILNKDWRQHPKKQ